MPYYIIRRFTTGRLSDETPWLYIILKLTPRRPSKISRPRTSKARRVSPRTADSRRALKEHRIRDHVDMCVCAEAARPIPRPRSTLDARCGLRDPRAPLAARCGEVDTRLAYTARPSLWRAWWRACNSATIIKKMYARSLALGRAYRPEGPDKRQRA
jgi:hypothetical protein